MIEKLSRKDYIQIIELGKLLKQNYSEKSISENETIYVYKNNNNIIGFIQIQQIYEVLDIINIVVKEEYRKQYVGKQLVEYVLKKHMPKRVMLEVRKTNSAIEFYKKLGFKEIRTIKNYYNNEDGIVMERSI